MADGNDNNGGNSEWEEKYKLGHFHLSAFEFSISTCGNHIACRRFSPNQCSMGKTPKATT